jgi:hypothetical protein
MSSESKTDIAIDAEKNLFQGHGTVLDAATFFKRVGATKKSLKSIGITLSSGITQDGFALASLPDSWFQAAVNDPKFLPYAVETGKIGLNSQQAEIALLELHSLLRRSGWIVSNIDLTFWREMMERLKAKPSPPSGVTWIFGTEDYDSTLPEQIVIIRAVENALMGKSTLGD